MISKASMLLVLVMLGGAAAPAAVPQSDPPKAAEAEPANPIGTEREPAAIAALESMGAYLRTLTTFAVEGSGSVEESLTTGQIIQYPGTIDLLASRPNRLRANLYSTLKRREYYYDGKTFTIFAPRQGFYAEIAAPASIKELLDKAQDRLGLVLPLSDLFELGSDPALTSRISTAFFVSTDVVNGQACNHYAFRQPNVDWQIWIRDGSQPLPCKWVITGAGEREPLSYEMEFTWDLKPTVPANAFTFVPPQGADRITLAAITK
ncbi:MAG TPA: DUF2092 domain-containing protein [Allosphingosinicella sp.]|nr:DUF2092 domain-containing protein [Allosphingosinicella sp.]